MGGNQELSSLSLSRSWLWRTLGVVHERMLYTGIRAGSQICRQREKQASTRPAACGKRPLHRGNRPLRDGFLQLVGNSPARVWGQAYDVSPAYA